MPDVQEGMLKGGLPCISFGDGPPLAVFPGLGMTNANPTGLQRWGSCACSLLWRAPSRCTG